MTQVKLALAAALMLVVGVSQASDKAVESLSQGEEKPAGVFFVTDEKKGEVTFYQLDEIDARAKDAKAGRLSAEEKAQFARESMVNIPKTAKKITTMKIDRSKTIAQAKQDDKSDAACGWWGWRRGWWGWGGGWGGCGWGCGGWGSWGWGTTVVFRPAWGWGGCGWYW